MRRRSIECKTCGCQLEFSDIRQLALYYRDDDPSMVAVQYICPRCGTVEWQRHDPDEWEWAPLEAACEWSRLALELGLRGGVSKTDVAAKPSPDKGVERGCQRRGSIGVDEYIEFCCRVNELSAEDLRLLSDST